MRLMKFAVIGAAVAVGITYLMDKKEDGTSIFDEIAENAPEWMDKAKEFAEKAISQVKSYV